MSIYIIYVCVRAALDIIVIEFTLSQKRRMAEQSHRTLYFFYSPDYNREKNFHIYIIYKRPRVSIYYRHRVGSVNIIISKTWCLRTLPSAEQRSPTHHDSIRFIHRRNIIILLFFTVVRRPQIV
jgi:hypothetical protein